MKKLFKRVALIVMALLTLSVGTGAVNEVKAADDTATITFDDVSKRTTFSTSQQVWEENGIKVTNNKSSSTNNVADYSKPVRFYAKSQLIIETMDNIAEIVFDANSSSYATALKNSIGTAATASSDKVTVELDGSTNSYTIESLAAQVRMDALTVTYFVAEGTPTITLESEDYTQVDSSITLTPTLNNIEGTIEWSSSDEDVATIVDGVLTAKSIGRTTITAKIGEVEATKDITVYPVAGSEISIADALKVCELTGSNEAPYTYSTTGTIESIDTAYNETYGNITVTITDGNNNSIQAYRMTGGSDLYEGAKIKVTGKLTTYNSTPEFVAGCTYELFESDEISSVLESLNKINSYMSLSYQYKETTTIEYNIVDVLNQSVTNVTSNKYTNWSDKKLNSSAIYAGQCAGSNQSIQLRSNNNNSGVITTASGGNVKKITVEWNSNTASGRILNVYGNNTAYSSPADLYNESTDGDLLGTIENGKSTELTITGDYQYIGFRSAENAMYLTSVSIEWETTEGHEVKTMSDSKFLIRCGIDSSIAEIEGVDTFGVKISAGSNTVYYSDSLTSTSDNGIDFTFVVINLGDIINDNVKLSTKFTVEAYVEVDSTKYVSELSKEYSVADMVNEYHTNGSDEVKAKVNHLYEYFVKQGLIVEEAN